MRVVSWGRRAGSLLMLCAACHGGGDDEAEVAPLVPVGMTVVSSDTITDLVTVVGRLGAIPGGSALLTAPAPAVVGSVAVQVGQRVDKDAMLLELEAPDLVAAARTASAQADLAERDAARQRELLSQGIASQRQADEKAAAATGARAEATAAAALLARMRVRSPIAGAVQSVAVQSGERVDAGAPLVEVIDNATLDLRAQVPAAELARLRLGQPAQVLGEGAGAPAAGKIVALAPAVDSLTNSGTAVIRIAHPPGELRPGAGATARITLGHARRALVVPDSALVVVGDSLSVYVVGADSLAHLRTVAAGVRRDGRAEILRGLEAGERIVSSGAFGLSDGVKVVAAAADSTRKP